MRKAVTGPKARERCRFATSLLSAALAAGLFAGHAWAQAAPAPRDFDIPAGALESAIGQFGKQSGLQVIYDDTVIAGKRASAVRGRLESTQGLDRLLRGTGLTWRRLNDDTLIIEPATPAAQPSPGAERSSNSSRQDAEPEVVTLSDVVVTGTRIRGGSTPSPVITIGAAQIQEEGFADLGEVIRSVPQNFNGGQNPGVMPGGSVDNQNVTGGSSLNLRGLGPDATLTLLNGRRLSYGGIAQSVDISAIPVEAVGRIEIVADGASAIYGSDAVAGVANVILRRDFDGVRVGARYGTATDGGLTTREVTATAGASWSSGGLIATYKDASVDPIYKDDRDYTQNLFAPYTIYPGSDLRSGLLSAYQSFGDAVELRLDAFRTVRDMQTYTAFPTLYYHEMGETTTSLAAPSIEFLLPGNWILLIGGTFGKEETISTQSMVTLATGIPAISRYLCHCHENRSYEVSAEGPLFALGGGDARLAVGAGYRTNSYLQRHYMTGITWSDADESSRFAYAEINLPLIGPGSNIANARQLVLTAAVRGEDYDSFGGVTTPKLGLIYGPSADFTLKASWGKSFKAPTLLQRGYLRSAYLDPANWYGPYAADATVLNIGGGNPNLGPERARTWTSSLAFHPEVLPDLEAELTWFDIEYSDRVVYPISWSSSDVLNNPSNAQFIVHSPTTEQQAEILATVDLNNVGMDYDASRVLAIYLNQYTNVAWQRVKGIDLRGSYGFDLGDSRLTLRGSASWLDSSQQTTAGQSAFDLAGTRANPAQFNSRLGAVWSRNGFAASAFANYTSGVTISAGTAGAEEKTASFTTFDATLRYGTGERGGTWSGLEFALSAQNLFDRAPPLYTPTSATALRYDSTNYSAIGRFVSMSVSKHW